MEQNEQRAAGLSRVLVLAAGTRSLGRTLSSWDIPDVVAATKSNTALAAIQSDKPFDLIICDATSSAESRFDFVASIRGKGERAPILVISDDPSLDALGRALRVGADDVLQKTYELLELRGTLASLFARSNERERANGAAIIAPLHGADVRVAGTGDDRTLSITAPTHSAQLESFERVCERVAARGLPESERMHLHLALEELLQNAREWGNRFDAAKRIRFSFTPKHDRVSFGLEDEGDGFNPTEIPDPSIDPMAHIKRRLASGKRIGGWGLFMARKSMDEIAFSPKGNAVYVTKLFHPAPYEPQRS